ncbi:hypothetical protein [uncultured Oscillibacter sp.]|uniref:hypothetical protein n=1 Tax=uncultured Oscillibacter sp. TaxID=876091 RepID=UPI00260A5034|nr:hypothetical protein [uncultured Oscillibacter sp.]
MAIINLRRYYPHYPKDKFLEVPDEVADALEEGRRMEGVPDCPFPPAGSSGGGGKGAERRGRGIVCSENGALIHRSGAVRPAGSCCVLRTRWGSTFPNPHVRQQK